MIPKRPLPMTAKEFSERTRAVNDAMRIFGELTDNNITKAFQAYMEVFEERQHELMVRASMLINATPRIMDPFERPKCPECGMDLWFRIVPKNDEGIKTQLICSSDLCDTVLNSDHDMAWWEQQLPLKKVPDASTEEGS